MKCCIWLEDIKDPPGSSRDFPFLGSADQNAVGWPVVLFLSNTIN